MKLFKLKQLVKILDKDIGLTVCYATTGGRIFKGKDLSELPGHSLEYYVTYILPSGSNLYVEVHENDNFSEGIK